jgi:biotin-dependent carboxylase-like uncharacterized protein
VIEILTPGPFATVQDCGRPGWAHLAISPSGAADRASLELANRLVGNPDGAAGIEATFGGLVLRARSAVLVAVTGAPLPVRRNGVGIGMGHAATLEAGEELALGAPWQGLRTYVALRGGLDVASHLGSRSTDVLGGLGPAPLAPGQLLACGPEPTALPAPDQVPLRPATDVVRLRARLGPRADWFSPEAARLLAAVPWRVRPESDRVGVRLDGPPLLRSVLGELPSEGVVSGAVQVPPDGRPLVFLVDHPTTGGYPVLAVVLSADRDRIGQLRPGQEVRFSLG